MPKQHIQTVAILGAGVMGAQIAAHFANAGLRVFLYDLVSDPKNPNSVVQASIQRLSKINPSPLAAPEITQFIHPANYEYDLEKLRECDLIIEAIGEDREWKESLYLKIVSYINEYCILASNTSGISIEQLAKVLPPELKVRFCGVHFFNPPRYMKLVELTPHSKTQADILDYLETFLTSYLGKIIIRAKDTPNFIANRIGVFSMLAIFHHMERLKLGFDEVDALTGILIGRAKSATFRTADIVGLDTLGHVIDNMMMNLADDPWQRYYKQPNWLKNLIAQGHTGQKAGVGIYKKVGKDILVLDEDFKSYRHAVRGIDKVVEEILLKAKPEEKLRKLAECSHPQAQFLCAIFCDLFYYTGYHAADISSTVRDIDMAMRYGFAWAEGPFETWQQAGWHEVLKLIEAAIKNKTAMATVALPVWIHQCKEAYKENAAYAFKLNSYIGRSELPVYKRQLFPKRVLNETSPKEVIIFENEGIRLWHKHDEIAIISFKTKKNTINGQVVAGVQQAIDIAEKQYKGLIIWQDKEENFSYGADLKYFSNEFEADPANAENIVSAFQTMCMKLRYCAIPTVVALRGLVLGGGCELALHADHRVAAFETYMGLVEAGVGLLPAGGGSKEFALKAYQRYPNDPFLFLKDYFKQIAMAEVSSSALDAKNRGFLSDSDTIVMHEDEILYVAKQKILQLSESSYKPPLSPPIKVAGKPGIATLQMQLLNMREGNFISEYDYYLASTIAKVLCGGEIEAGSIVTEEWLLKLERQAFMELAAQAQTQERIQHTLATGKPLRN